jgi:hypothetical protein
MKDEERHLALEEEDSIAHQRVAAGCCPLPKEVGGEARSPDAMERKSGDERKKKMEAFRFKIFHKHI